MKYKSIHSDTQKSLNNLALFVHGFHPLSQEIARFARNQILGPGWSYFPFRLDRSLEMNWFTCRHRGR